MRNKGFESLNEEQRRAVDAWDRPVLVMAPVGTGKTKTLALRAARALAAGIEPRRILCLSFTNKAAREMQTRLASVVGKPAQEVTAKTFHGLCALILRAESKVLGLDGDFLIYDEEDSTELISRLWKSAGIQTDHRDVEKLNFLLNESASKSRLARYDEVEPRRPQQIFEGLLQQSGWGHYLLRERIDFARLLRDYVHELRENHAVDFTDLITGVNRLWDEHPAVLQAWRAKFVWIQVDEVQDTSRAEYRILCSLAGPGTVLSFFGDIDQTIYEWRGSAPFEILQNYRERFEPLELPLVRNYRSTRAILQACASLIRSCPGAVTADIVAQQAEEGEAVRIVEAADPSAEAEWIAAQVDGLHRSGLPYSEIAVLARTNFTARDISKVFGELGIPHLQVEQQKFFQRAEVKAALAHLRLLVNLHDANSLMRVLKTPPKGIGEATIEKLRGEPRAAGLKITDLLDTVVLQAGDPFALPIQALNAGQVVVFDTETTGTDTREDEIVEIAAAKCDVTGALSAFHAYLRPNRPVGESQAIHGWSDDFLKKHGRDPAEVIEEFRRFCSGSALAGHNIFGFDIPILDSFSRRRGLDGWTEYRTCDTLDLARRLLKVPRYTLGHLADALKLDAVPTHKAMDDVRATVELLRLLIRRLEAGEATRRSAIAAATKSFAPLARRLDAWRDRARMERPHELLRRIIDESGLADHYATQKDGAHRTKNLEELCLVVEANDQQNLPPAEALVQVLNVASLGNDLERRATDEDRVPILTVNQAKGLEFDTVFIANAADDEFPSFRSKREGRMAEEHRLFYVAASRARKRLIITWPKTGTFGKKRLPSPFLAALQPGISAG